MASSGDYKRIQEHEIQDFAKSQIGFAVNVLEDVYQGLNKLFPGLMGKFPELSVLLEPRLQTVYRKRSEVVYEDDGNKQAQGTGYDVNFILPLFADKKDLFFDVHYGHPCSCVFVHCECSVRDRDQKVKSGSITVSVSPLIPKEPNLKYNHVRIDYINHIHAWKLSTENWLLLAEQVDTIKRQHELKAKLISWGIIE